MHKRMCLRLQHEICMRSRASLRAWSLAEPSGGTKHVDIRFLPLATVVALPRSFALIFFFSPPSTPIEL